MRRADNTILVTGGSGIGAALAQRLHDSGNTVIVSGRRRDALERATAGRPRMHAIAADMTDPGSIAALAERAIAGHPRLNVLVNNAGVMRFETLRTLNEAAARARGDDR